MGLLPLEFTDCLSDSPYFRENLHAHEKELELTSNQIKGMIKQVKELLEAAKVLSRAQRSLASTLSNFTFDCIGTERTDDEIIIAGSLKEFGRLLNTIEDERDRMLERASSTFIEPIDAFRTHQIGAAKEGKKKFDKETTKFCGSLERHLNLSTKKSENSLQEADANLGMEQRHFVQASLEYILKLQEVQERKKFEFVETILSFMYGWLTFYHQGHEVAKDFKSFMTDLQVRLQRTRDNYTATQHEAENLMMKMLEARKTKPQDPGSLNKMYARQGYLFLLEKKAFGTTHWIKHFCQYQKETRRFTMIPYNQTVSKISSTETITLRECVRRMSDSIDKRFCFDVIPSEKPSSVFTFQALSEEDRKLWLDAMDGQDPIHPSAGSPSETLRGEECALDERGFAFARKCIEWIEERSLEDQGLYRVVGVASRVNRLIQNALDRRKMSSNGSDGFSGSFDMSSEDWEIRTVTSALKQFFRNLPEPLMSYRLHQAFIAAAKQENKNQRVDIIHCLVHDLPPRNFEMLHLLIRHLQNVASKSDKNLMTISNLSVCFGPTLLRPEDESMSGILDIKFANVVVEILIENCDKIFNTEPVEGLRPSPSTSQPRREAPAIASVTPSGFNPPPIQQQPIYVRATNPLPEPPTYATIPARGSTHGQVLRSSSSQDHLSGPVHARQAYHIPYPAPPQRVGPPLYPVPPSGPNPPAPVASVPASSTFDHQTQINGTHSRPSRPLAVYQPWNNSSQQPPLVQGLDAMSPPSSGSSSDSGAQAVCFRSPSTSPSNAVFYAYGPTRPPQPQTQAPPQPVPPAAPQTLNQPAGRRVRALYNCVGENPAELSFEPNAIILNVRMSKEPGWLEGTYRGRTGLIPQNYVQWID